MSRPAPTRPGFTLVELLVVIGIITILIVLSIAVAQKVTGTGKKAATMDALKALDTALNAYIQEKGSAPPAWVVDPRPGNPNERYIIPVVDGRNLTGAGEAMINSVALFLLQCKESPQANASVVSLDPKILREFDPDAADPSGGATWTLQPKLPTVIDGWGNPIRYVHPAFKGLIHPPGQPGAGVDLTATGSPSPAPPGKQYQITTVRRNTQETSGNPPPYDSDGGINTASRPYFYSCGPDGDPATTDDNVYLTTPRFQKSN